MSSSCEFHLCTHNPHFRMCLLCLRCSCLRMSFLCSHDRYPLFVVAVRQTKSSFPFVCPLFLVSIPCFFPLLFLLDFRSLCCFSSQFLPASPFRHILENCWLQACLRPSRDTPCSVKRRRILCWRQRLASLRCWSLLQSK